MMAANRKAKTFTKTAVIQIRRRAKKGEKLKDIASDLGVSGTQISAIATGKRYSEYGGPITRRHKQHASRGSNGTAALGIDLSGLEVKVPPVLPRRPSVVRVHGTATAKGTPVNSAIQALRHLKPLKKLLGRIQRDSDRLQDDLKRANEILALVVGD
jgi:transcriptional regulator with XRE-family HTH domain